MTDQIVEQLVVREQSEPIEGQLSRPVALFNPDGTALVPVQGSVTPEYPKLLASWFLDNGSSPMAWVWSLTLNTVNFPLDSEEWNVEVGRYRYIHPELDHWFPGDDAPIGGVLAGRFTCAISSGHAYNVSYAMGFTTPLWPDTEAGTIAGDYLLTREVWVEPDYDTWDYENGIYLNNTLRFTVSPAGDGDDFALALYESMQLADEKPHINNVITLPPTLPRQEYLTLSSFLSGANLNEDIYIATKWANISITDLGPLWPEA